MSSPDPVTVRLSKSAAKVVSSARSDGLIGAASTLIKTSFSEGVGIGTLAIEIVISPALVTVDMIPLEVWSDMLYSPDFYFRNGFIIDGFSVLIITILSIRQYKHTDT